jgi:putative tryptophan/tyrosine transport system substrate-binding protein
MIQRRTLVAMIGGAAIAGSPIMQSQGADNRPLIAVIGTAFAAQAMRQGIIGGFLAGLHDLGYAEGKNVEIAYRFAEGRPERYPAFAEELMALKPDIIVTPANSAAHVLMSLTKTIPIIVPGMVDPVSFGFVASEARPGGNVTGIRSTLPGLWAKLVELSPSVLPDARRIGCLIITSDPDASAQRQEVSAASAALSLEIITADVGAVDDLDSAFRTLSNKNVQIVVIPGDGAFPLRARIVPAAAGMRVPTIYPDREFVELGGLLSYGVNRFEIGRRSAAFVDKILKGAMPSDLPVEFPTKLELVINLKTAKTLGITIPPTLLVRADEVTE